MISALLTGRGREWAEHKQVTGDSPLISWLPLVMEDFWMLASDSSSVSLSTETENMVSLMVSNRWPGLSLYERWKLLKVEKLMLSSSLFPLTDVYVWHKHLRCDGFTP